MHLWALFVNGAVMNRDMVRVELMRIYYYLASHKCNVGIFRVAFMIKTSRCIYGKTSECINEMMRDGELEEDEEDIENEEVSYETVSTYYPREDFILIGFKGIL